MAFQATQNGARVWCKLNWGGKEYGNVLWFSKPEISYEDLEDLADVCLSAYKSSLTGSFNDDVVIGPFYAYDMRTSGGVVVQSTVATGAGTNASDPLPIATCVVATHYTANRGRAYRGRSYLGGFVEGDLINGVWQVSLANGITGMFGAIKTNAAAIGWTFGVRSGTLDGVQRAVAVVTPITTTLVRSTIPGSQRTRYGRP